MQMKSLYAEGDMMHQIPDFTELLKLARSPAGQQLISHLQLSGGEQLQQAINTASTGDYSQAKKTLSSLMDSPEVRSLLKQLEESE